MSSWVLSIASIVILTSLITMILPEGKLNKSIKSIFSLLVVLVIIQPFLSFSGNHENLDSIFNGNELNLQTEYLDYIESQKITNYQKNCQKILANYGIEGASVDINYTVIDKHVVIEKVLINLTNNTNSSINKETIEKVIIDISLYLNLTEEKVLVYE